MATLIDNIIFDISRCPQCGVATPLLTIVGKPSLHIEGRYEAWWYLTAQCSRCCRHVLFYGKSSDKNTSNLIEIHESFPELRSAARELPQRALNFIQQAYESKHAPDGAVMLSASAIDAMLKEKGLVEGSLFARIEQATANGLLTSEMRDWAHEIRLSANEPRHADEQYMGASDEDAAQILEFADALGEYLFVLPARVEKWKSKAAADEALK